MEADYRLVQHRIELSNHIYSERGNPLALFNAKPDWDQPILTVELYIKWYELYLLEKAPKEFYPNVGFNWLRVYSLNFGHLEGSCPEGLSPYVDHVPNPAVVRIFAKNNDWRIDEIAEELIEGRWQIEVRDKDIECPLCEGKGYKMVPSMALRGTEVKNSCSHCRGRGTVKRGD